MSENHDLLLLPVLQDEWVLLQASVETLLRSVGKCKAIGTKSEYSFEEQESFDSLTSKFNRTSDLFTQKVIRTTWMLLHEPFTPFIDMMNTGEKIQMLSSADQMIGIRDLRNQIAHEYIPEAIRELVPEVIEVTGKLTDNINRWREFVVKRNWLNPTEGEI